MKTIYPYDPDANLASNRVTDDVSINTYPNAFKVVVPESAPFYRYDLEVRTTDDQLLIEGLDYYLAYYSKDISEATGKPVYGGIMLFDTVDAKVKLRAVGGNHMVPASEVGRFLTDPELEEPRNVDWSELQRYPTTVEPVDKPDDIDEALEQDVVVKALDGVRQKLVAKLDELDDRYDEVIAELGAVADKVYDHELWTHHKAGHKHNYTRADLNVLGANETAADAIKAYGLTLQEVVDEMMTFGINQSRIDGLIDDTLPTTIKGRLNVDTANNLVFQHKSGNAKVSLNGYDMAIETTAGEIVFEADTNSNDAGIGLEIASGLNTLLVPSSGNVQGDAPSFNGKVLITTDNINDFLHKPQASTANVQSTDSETVEFSGRGVESSPFAANAIAPIATASKSGLWLITDSLLITSEGYGISQWAITQIKNSLDGYVDKSFTINGEVFGSDEEVTLTKTHIGLQHAQNTAPADKPVTTALTNATASKALDGHSHQKSDLKNVPSATNSVEGLGYLHDVMDSTSDKFAVPALGQALHQAINGVEQDVAGRAKSGIASATFYGGNGYLPVPALGNYGHANYSYPAFYGEEDKNLKWTILVNLASDFGRGVFYHEIQLAESGAILYHNKTSVEYLPPFLAELGRTCTYIFGGLDGLFHIRDNTGQDWLVRSMGTMDMSKHRACKIPGSGRDYRYTIHGDYVYRIHAYVGHDDRVFVVRAPLSVLLNGGTITWTDVVLTGLDIYGNQITGSVKFAPLGMSEDPNAQSLIWRNDGGKWTTINPRHSSQNWDMILDGDILTVFTYQRAYCANAYTSSYGPSTQTTCTKIDLSDFSFEIQQPELMKQELNESGIVSQEPSGLNGWPGVEPNNSSMRLFGKKFFLACRWYGTHSAQSVYVCKIPDGVTKQQLCERRSFGYSHKSSGQVNGPTPSVIVSVRSMPSWIDNTKMVYRDLNTGFNMCEINPDQPYPDDNGLGPTTNRVSYSSQFHLSRIPRDWKEGAEVNQGYTGIPNEKRYTFADSDGNFSNEMTWDNANGVTLREKCRAAAIAAGSFTEDRRISDQAFLTVFGDPTNPTRAFVMYAAQYFLNDNKDSRGHVAYVYTVDVSVSSAIITVSNDALIYNAVLNTRTTGVGTSIPESPQSITYETEEGIRGYVLHNNPMNSHVGNSGRPDFQLQETTPGVWRARWLMNYSYRFTNLAGYHPKFGYYRMSQTASADAVIGYVAGRKADDIWSNVSHDTVYILASTAEEGWIVYFTQDMPFYAEQTLYTVPASDFDLRTLFPGAHQNRTFYIHVDVTDGTPKYTINNEVLPDTPTRLWIGHVTTDDKRIIELNAERARRLGNIAPLLQHSQNKYAHGYDFSDSLLSSEYTLLENKGMVHDFDVVSFKDVFDSWYRFSHNTSGNYPANAVELEQWRYLEESDTIENLTNSSTFIGFISDKLAGDYVFNTVVSSSSNDDDGIFIVLAAFKQGDIDSKEHTLSLQVNTGGFGTTTPYVCIHKNFSQSNNERIFTLDPNSDGSNTGTGWSPAAGYDVYHIYAKREKNRLLVYVDRQLLPKVSGVTYEKTVGDYVDSVRGLQIADFESQGYLVADLDLAQVAPEFARATRFGYGSLSQPFSRFWNIERPLSNLDAFYSSEQMILESIEKADGAIEKVYGTVLSSSVGVVHSANNYGYKTWPKAVENQYAGSSSGSYERPPGAKYISPDRSWNPPANHSFHVCMELDLQVVGAGQTKPLVTVRATADDALNLWVDGSNQGQIATSVTTNWAKRFTKGKHKFFFVCTNIPANSPSFTAFTITDENGATIATSDETWFCDDGYGGNASIKVARVQYIIDKDVEDVFVAYCVVNGVDTIPAEAAPAEYEDLGDGTYQVSRYVDVTIGDAAWELTKIKKKI